MKTGHFRFFGDKIPSGTMSFHEVNAESATQTIPEKDQKNGSPKKDCRSADILPMLTNQALDAESLSIRHKTPDIVRSSAFD